MGIHIHIHQHYDSEKLIVKHLERVNCKLDELRELLAGNGGTAELEKQMDSWLLRLDTELGKIEQISESVDSNK